MSPAAFAPQEILERIFRHAATGTLDVPSKSWRLCSYPNIDAAKAATKAIGQVPLVNRHWNEAATRILYWELVVNEGGEEETSAALPKNALLTRTLEQSPRLQAYVRSLYLITFTADNDREEFKWLNLRILRCCTLLQHLWISGWISSLLNQCHTTIATFTGLRYLSIQPSRNPFCSFERLETMMRGWPNLERLEIIERVIADDSSDSGRSTQPPPMVKHVTRLSLHGPVHLEGFTLITPNLAELVLGVHRDLKLFLLHAQRWKRTLRCLKLSVRFAIADTQWRAVMMALCGFERLQRLRLRAPFPLALLSLPDTLEEITVKVRSEDLLVIFDVLDQKLPRLIRKVKLVVNYPDTGAEKAQRDLESALRAFCDKRKWKWRVHALQVYLISSS